MNNLIFKRKIVIDTTTIPRYEDDMIVYANDRVKVEETYQKLIHEAGCTDEQAREQTAYAVKHYREYINGNWSYIGVFVTAYEIVRSTIDPERTAQVELEYDCLHGINSDCGKDYLKQVTEDCAFTVAWELKKNYNIDISDDVIVANLIDEPNDDVYLSEYDKSPVTPLPPKPNIPNMTVTYDDHIPHFNATCDTCGIEYINIDDDFTCPECNSGS